MLLRVSSNQQLEADGDLSVQRRLVLDYIRQHEEWEMDGKEYFEGSMSGYKTAVDKRDTLQEALEDARNGEYDILAAYKDDRIGRRMWEIGSYVMALKSCNVDIYTVKDGCISPESGDIMGQMMLALRYGSAQKSSADTGMRVKDTAGKLVQQGKFMGGAAPYGYRLVLSGELSKHGRALHRLEIVPERAEAVRHIYALSLYRELGSAKIARLLNEDDYYKTLAPNDVWKSGAITSILTNPVYAGYTAYKRRERINGKYHRLSDEEWIRSEVPNESIRVIDEEMWNRTQEKRKSRSDKYVKAQRRENTAAVRRNDGTLPLIDVIYCGCCGGKMTNGSRYSYWTIKKTGEKRTRIIPVYRCQSARDGIPHSEAARLRADRVEKPVFDCLAEYIGRLQEKEDVLEAIARNRDQEKRRQEAEIAKLQRELERIIQGIAALEERIPEAVTGACALPLEELTSAIRRQKEKKEEKEKQIREKREAVRGMDLAADEWKELKGKPLTWQQIFREADVQTKRVLVNQLIERIDVTDERIAIRFRIGADAFYRESAAVSLPLRIDPV
ncbi:MAG: recombinase family protein [Roseburia sp.]|nr:recombinase family protein [Roseburia sp.]MCM1097282.1 recombinase family protein [Ruminococcus flavefaciens]